jgi:hypothetical protein
MSNPNKESADTSEAGDGIELLQVEKKIIETVIMKAVELQKSEELPWGDAVKIAFSLQPGGGHSLKLIDDVVTYEADGVCLGGWLVGLDKIKVRPCQEIDWPAYLPD